MNKNLWLKVLKIIMKIIDFIIDEAEEAGQGTGDNIQKCMFPMEYLRITADENYNTHKGGLAVDMGGKDGGKDMLYAPCDMFVKRIRKNANGEVYFESVEPVKFADGSIDYFRMLLMHDDKAADRLNEGDLIIKGDWCYTEGGMGGGDPNCFANHVHIEVGKGQWKNAKHFELSNGNFSIEEPSKIEDIFFVDKNVAILNDAGKKFKII